MAPNKPEIELFDLRKDPHEVHNVADDPSYATVKAELLAKLDDWRKNVIKDQGVSDDFHGKDQYPDKCPTPTVGDWVQQNSENKDYDFIKHGAPSWYPTRTLEQWQKVRALWEPYVFREPDAPLKRPVIPFTKKPKR